ncbi:Hpt domain-containing protein [Steroidobacter sp. S1-65]|uniref:Hpt domain-containing protein n=1 Tax=Steroidobacter gossypii TaxID=2805490 RepID=A0ABS1X4I9_9GAMM|nr:Hpt domain-containing protein [Steroidobacter gossypii]MBM0108130.1 Hpt domain-containing protein [Steroidobacter gossypii]
MPDPPQELRARMIQIAGRFLDRVSREIVQLRGMIDAAAGGDLTMVREIETLAHRMHGSGAMLRFNEIADRAGELERLAASFVAAGTVDQPRMLDLYRQLQAAIEKACAARAASIPPP